MAKFTQNKWKYSTIGLLAILAVGFSFPQAFAHVTNSLAHNVQHILDEIAGIRSDVNDIEEQLDSSGNLQIVVVSNEVEVFVDDGDEAGTRIVLIIPDDMEGTLDLASFAKISIDPLTSSSHRLFLRNATGDEIDIFTDSQANEPLGPGDRLIYECELDNPQTVDTRCTADITIWMKLRSIGES